MKGIKVETITPSQMTHTTISAIIGVGILSLAGGAVKYAHQDGWITILLGSIYPIITITLIILIAKRHPHDNILVLSRKYFGIIFGNILNLFLSGFYLLYAVIICTGLCDVIRVFLVPFLSPRIIFSVVFIAVAYTSSKGIKTLAKANQVIFYAAIGLYIIPSIAILKSNYLNISPIFGSGFSNIMKGTTASLFAYSGSEMIFILYPLIDNKQKLKSSLVKSIAFVTFIYTWFTLLNILYLGPDMISKYIWPFIPVADSVNIPVITNFRFIFLFLWVLFIYKTVTNQYFASVYVLDDIFKSIKFKKISMTDICYLLYPVAIFSCLKIKDEIARRNFIDDVVPKYTIFVISFPIIILLLSYFKSTSKVK